MAKGLRSNTKRVVRSLRRIAVVQHPTVLASEEKRAAAMEQILAKAKANKEKERVEQDVAMADSRRQREAETRGRQGGPLEAAEPPEAPSRMEVDSSVQVPVKGGKTVKGKGKRAPNPLGLGLNNFHPRYKKGTKRRFKSIFTRHE